MSGDTNLCSPLSPLKHLLCDFLSQTPPPSFPASFSLKPYVRKHLNLPKEKPRAEEQTDEQHVKRRYVVYTARFKLTALNCARPVISAGPETTKRYVNGRGRIMKEIPLSRAAVEQAWVLSALNGPPGEPHSAPDGKWG